MFSGAHAYTVTQKITSNTLTREYLNSVSTQEYENKHKEWLEAAVRTGNVATVNMLVSRFPRIVADHPDGFPCAFAFEQHNLPMLETLLKEGANANAKYKGKNLLDYGLDLFLIKGTSWYSWKNWYRRCMKRVLAFRPITAENTENYNEAFTLVLKELCGDKVTVGADKLLLRLLQAGVDPNVAKQTYFATLITKNKHEIIKLLRQFGADFSGGPKVKDNKNNRTFDSLKDYAKHLEDNDWYSKNQKCGSAITASITSGEQLFKRLESEYRLSGFRQMAVANKESIYAYILRLPENEKLEALRQIANNEGALGLIFWSKRGYSTPTAANGMRAVASAGYSYFAPQQKQTVKEEESEKKNRDDSASLLEASRSSTAAMSPILGVRERKDTDAMSTNVFEAEMAALPNVRGSAPVPAVPAPAQNETERVKMHS